MHAMVVVAASFGQCSDQGKPCTNCTLTHPLNPCLASPPQILGVHVVGENATEIVHVGQLAMDMGMDIYYFTETVFNYPTFAEAYRTAAFNGIKRLGLYKTKAPVSPPAIGSDAVAVQAG